MSKKKIERDRFVFFKSYWQQFQELETDKQKVELINAICEVQFLEKKIEKISFKDKLLKIIWLGIVPIVKQSINGYIAKYGALESKPYQGATQGGEQAPTEHKEREKEKERENNIEREEIFFNLYENLNSKKQLTDKFIKHLISTENVKSETSYSSKIKNQLSKGNKVTLINFEEWYLNSISNELNTKYCNYPFFKIDDKKIHKIVSFYDLELNNKSIFTVYLLDEDKNRAYPIAVDSVKELSNYLEGAIEC